MNLGISGRIILIKCGRESFLFYENMNKIKIYLILNFKEKVEITMPDPKF